MSESEGRGVACVAVRWEDAADLGELWEGAVLDVEVAGEHVLLVRLPGGEVRAYQGLCPHQKMLLADGDFDADSGVLVCMGHLSSRSPATASRSASRKTASATTTVARAPERQACEEGIHDDELAPENGRPGDPRSGR